MPMKPFTNFETETAGNTNNCLVDKDGREAGLALKFTQLGKGPRFRLWRVLVLAHFCLLAWMSLQFIQKEKANCVFFELTMARSDRKQQFCIHQYERKVNGTTYT